jgi:hypothetical protein
MTCRISLRGVAVVGDGSYLELVGAKKLVPIVHGGTATEVPQNWCKIFDIVPHSNPI